jgi:hypothetical protein
MNLVDGANHRSSLWKRVDSGASTGRKNGGGVDARNQGVHGNQEVG